MTYYKTRYRNKGYPDEGYGKTITCQWVPQVEAYKCKFPKNQTFIDFIKSKIPSGKREWLPDEKSWLISEDFFEALLPIAKATFHAAKWNVIDKKTVEEYNQGRAMAPTVVPIEQIKERFYQLTIKAGINNDDNKLDTRKVYLRAARYYHPDLHPERASEMSELNYLWQIMQEQGEQNGNGLSKE